MSYSYWMAMWLGAVMIISSESRGEQGISSLVLSGGTTNLGGNLFEDKSAETTGFRFHITPKKQADGVSGFLD